MKGPGTADGPFFLALVREVRSAFDLGVTG